MSDLFETGAVIGTPEGPGRRMTAACDALLGELGYTAIEDRGSEDLVRFPQDTGGWLAWRVPLPIARAMGHRLAARVGRTIHLFTVTARHADPLHCVVDDLRLAPDGRVTPGSVGRSLEGEFGDDWGDLCDHKGTFLLGATLDAALDAWAPDRGDGTRFRLVPPASLGDPRLDALALQVRLAGRAEVSVLDGRRCVRVALPDATVVTTFLDDPGLATLRSAVGALLAG